ncbi:neuronal pentraxin-1-like [Oculina patagonica]
MPSMTEFTVCLWMKLTETKGTPFSYATDTAAHGNELLLYYESTTFKLWVGGSEKRTSVSANDGNWHHICATWKNTGAWKFYKDGSLAQSGAGFQTGYTVKGGGSLMLGQEQDSTGGGLVANESLKGMLTNVNVWNRELTSCEIEALSTNSCLAGEGNVYKWADFIYGVKGNAAVVIPSPCSP